MPLRTSSIHGVSIPCLVPLTTSGMRPPIILADSSIVIGSGDAAQIRLKSLSVSKAHALVLVDDGNAYVRDLASRTELFVNDVAVREAVLKHGDVVRVGKFGFGVTEDPTVAELQRPRAAPPTVLLRVGDEAELRRVSEPVVLIGRRARCDITLADDSLSGAHAVMFRIGRRWFLRDLSSRTGTFVNGELIRQQRGLEDGDLIRVGRVDVRFVGEERISVPDAMRGGRSEESATTTTTPAVAPATVAMPAVSTTPAEVASEAESEVSMASLAANNIFGLADGSSPVTVAADASADAPETPLPELQHFAGTATNDLQRGTAWDTEGKAERMSQAAVVADFATPETQNVPESPTELGEPTSMTIHPMHDSHFDLAPPAARDSVERADTEATEKEWDESVAVWSFEDLARRASGDGGTEEEAADGRGLIWVAVGVGAACLGLIAWLIAFKLR